MTFKALVVEETGGADVVAAIKELTEDQLPAGNVTVAVEYTTVNSKDGLCMQPKNGLVRKYPHVPGIDFAGTVELSDDSRNLLSNSSGVAIFELVMLRPPFCSPH
jgi:acrylyl-CoA reductase (NADPH)